MAIGDWVKRPLASMPSLIAVAASRSDVSDGIPSAVLLSDQMLGRASEPNHLRPPQSVAGCIFFWIAAAHQNVAIAAPATLPFGGSFPMASDSILG